MMKNTAYEILASLEFRRVLFRSGVGQELLDAPRGDVGLLRHSGDQRRLGLAIDEPGFDRAVDDEHHKHEADEINHVLGEQTAIKIGRASCRERVSNWLGA